MPFVARPSIRGWTRFGERIREVDNFDVAIVVELDVESVKVAVNDVVLCAGA